MFSSGFSAIVGTESLIVIITTPLPQDEPNEAAPFAKVHVKHSGDSVNFNKMVLEH